MNPIRAWNAFWFAPVSARPLGAYRIAFGLAALMNLALLVVDADHWLSDAGLLRGNEAKLVAGPYRFSLLHYYQDPSTVHALLAAEAVALVLLTVGWHARTMSVLSYLGMLCLHHRNIATSSGADVLVVCLGFCLMFCPSGAAYSLDARRAARRRGTAAEVLIEPWGCRMIQIQLVTVYLLSSILKCNGTAWLNGTALHYVLHNAEVRRFALEPIQQSPLLINLMTYGALAFELSIPFLIWFRATRPWIMTVGLAFHIGVLFVVNIPVFGELMLAAYFLFLTPPELDAVLGALDPRHFFRSRAASADSSSILSGPHRLTQAGFRFLHDDDDDDLVVAARPVDGARESKSPTL